MLALIFGNKGPRLMRYSKKVGIAGVLTSETVLQYGAFMTLSATCVCKAIEAMKDESDD